MQEADMGLQAAASTEAAVLQRAPVWSRILSGEDDTTITTADETNPGVGGTPRILVVEDDTLISIDIECMLEELGYTVSGVVNHIGSALDFLDKHSDTIDCAILDIQLAGQTCLPIARALDDLGVPYLFVTGHDRETVGKLGLTGRVVEKPFYDQHLAAHLSALVAPPRCRRGEVKGHPRQSGPSQ